MVLNMSNLSPGWIFDVHLFVGFVISKVSNYIQWYFLN